MRCRDLVLSAVFGIVLLLFTLLLGSGSSNPLGHLVAQVAFGFWYVGVAAAFGAAVLRLAKRWPTAQAVLGYVGVAWLTFLAASVAFLLVVLVINPCCY